MIIFGLSLFWSLALWLVIGFNVAVGVWSIWQWVGDLRRANAAPEAFEHWPNDEVTR